MDCVIRIIVPSLNILLGLTTLSLQIATYVIWTDQRGNQANYSWDTVSSGIWGGAITVLTSLLILANWLTEKRAIQCLTGLGALSGVVMVGLYSWALDQYLNSNFGRMNVSCGQIRNLYRVQACDFLAISSVFIILGFLIMLCNGVLTYNASVPSREESPEAVEGKEPENV